MFFGKVRRMPRIHLAQASVEEIAPCDMRLKWQKCVFGKQAFREKRKAFKDTNDIFFDMLACPFTVNEEVMFIAFGHPLLCQIITAIILDVLCLGRSAHMKTKGHAATFAGPQRTATSVLTLLN